MRFWYGLAVAGLLVVATLAAWGIAGGGAPADLVQAVLPGERELQLPRRGTYVLFHERSSMVDGRYFSSGPVDGMRLQVAAMDTGEPLRLFTPSVSSSYTLAGRSGVSVAAFEVGRAGRYRLIGRYDDGAERPAVVFAVGQTRQRRSATTATGTGIGIVVALVLSGVAMARCRERANRQVTRPSARRVDEGGLAES